jgi:acyl-CoA thioester hydrolase
VTDAPRDGFSMVQRVRFGDLDAMQHMNNVEFLRFFETARIDFITSLAPEHDPGQPNGFGFIFAECHINYRAPAHYNELIRTWIRPIELKRSSVKLGFEMRVEESDRLVAEGWGTLVGYDYAAGSAHPIPDAFRERVEPLLG